MSNLHPRASRALRAGLLAVVAVSLLAAPVLAGKPAGRAGSGGTVRVDNGVFAGTTTAYAGPASATWVRALCYQNGRLVLEQYRAFNSTRTATLTLGPTPSWSGGSATCTAQDGYWRNGSTWRVTSTSSFSVSG